MRIQSCLIDSFGAIHQREIRDLSPKITVFYGPNEAGKSTLMAFIRTVLYGFPQRLGAQFYAPETPGRHGGRVVVRNDEGEWTIERLSTKNSLKVTRPDGSLGNADDLKRVLCFSTETVFKNIFSFGLSELQDFSTLTTEEVREKIFSGSVSGTGPSAREIIQRLDVKAQELLKIRGKSTVISTLISELRETEDSIRHAQQLASSYAQAKKYEDERRQKIEALTEQSNRLRREEAHLSLVLDLWPDWSRRELLLDELKKFKVPEGITRERVDAIADLKRKIEVEAQKAEELRVDRETELREIERLTPDSVLLAKADRAQRLVQDASLYRSHVELIRVKSTEVYEVEAPIRDLLLELGGDWDESRVLGVDRSIPRHEEVRTWAARLEGEAQKIVVLEAQIEQLTARRTELNRLIETTRNAASVYDGTASHEELDELEMMIRNTRIDLVELKSMVERREALRAQISDREGQLTGADQSEIESPVPGIAVPLLLFMTVISASVAAWRFLKFDYLTAGGALVALAIFALISFVMMRVQARVKKQNEREAMRVSALREQIELSKHRAEENEKQILDAERRIAEASNDFGLDQAIAHVRELEKIEAEWLVRKANREKLDRHLESIETHEESLENLTVSEKAAKSDLERLRQNHVKSIADWMSWKEQIGVPSTLSPQGVLDFFEKVRVIREKIQTRDRLRSEISDLKAEVGAWENQAQQLLERKQAADWVDAAMVFNQSCQNELRKNTGYESRQARLREIEVKLEAVESKLVKLTADVAEVLSLARVDDLRDFDSKAIVFEKYERLSQQTAEINERFLVRLGSQHAVQVLENEFRSGSLELWQARSEEIAHLLEKQQSERDQAIAELTEATMSREELERASDVPRLELERQRILAAVEKAIRNWSVLTLAKGLIEESLAVFEREHQPKVLSQASRIFATVTGGRYERIFQGESGSEVVVIDAQGRRKRTEELSRGTAEQLYFSLRLGLAHSFSSRLGSLPLIMDDVCVNFDPDRTREMIRALGEFSSDHQILYFTCQPWVRDLFLEVVPGTDVRTTLIGN